MKTLNKILIALFAMTFLFATACKKDEGFKGKKDITGHVDYPGGHAAGAIVSVSFGATSETGNVDFRTVTDSEGNYSFSGLQKGDYFLDATYTDNHGFTFDSPGVHVEIKNTKDELKVDFNLQ